MTPHTHLQKKQKSNEYINVKKTNNNNKIQYNKDTQHFNFNELNGADSSREATSCVATQELPNILWNPKVLCSK
jgi:hypothetical protein